MESASLSTSFALSTSLTDALTLQPGCARKSSSTTSFPTRPAPPATKTRLPSKPEDIINGGLALLQECKLLVGTRRVNAVDDCRNAEAIANVMEKNIATRRKHDDDFPLILRKFLDVFYPTDFPPRRTKSPVASRSCQWPTTRREYLLEGKVCVDTSQIKQSL